MDSRNRDRPNEGRQAAMKKIGQRRLRRRRRLRVQALFVLLFFLAGVIAALCLTVLFPVKIITVTGNTRYDAEQIIAASALATGKNLFLSPADQAAGRIQSQLPYIGKAAVIRRLPDTLEIQVEEEGPSAAYRTGNGFLLVNSGGKILERSADPPEGMLQIEGMEPSDGREGQQIAFADPSKGQLLEQLRQQIDSYHLQVESIDLTDAVDIRFVIENRILVEFGSASDLEYKMTHLVTALKDIQPDVTGTLNLKWWTSSKKDAYFQKGSIGTSGQMSGNSSAAE